MRTTAPSPASLRVSKTGLSPKTVQPNEPVRSPKSALKNVFPFEAVFATSFFTTSRLAKGRPFAPVSGTLRSRTDESGSGSAMGFHELGVSLDERMLHVVEQRVEDGLTRQHVHTGAGEFIDAV